MRKSFSIVAAFGLLLMTAACGNQTDRGSFAKAVRQNVLTKPSEAAALPSQAELEANIKSALGNSDKRLAIAVVENRNSFTFLTEIARNGAYGTWGSPDRRSITMAGGIITATRGLGSDLMAADIGAVSALIKGRRSGAATRVHYYLDGENNERGFSFSCQVERTGNQGIDIGEIKAKAAVLTETCSSELTSFANTYLVDSRGRIVQSRQWLGAKNGYITVQHLRL